MMDQVSEARIKAILEKLVSFGTRNTMSNPDDPAHGVGAARNWILKEMQSYSPKLQVHFEKFRVKKQGQRIFKDVDLYNVVAVLPGKTRCRKPGDCQRPLRFPELGHAPRRRGCRTGR